MAAASLEQLTSLESILHNSSGNVPLHTRFRALFTLKSLGPSSPEAISIISRAFDSPTAGALLKHELAYCLGQTRNPSALPVLEKVLGDEGEDPMVRHEAAEAMGAISSEESIGALKKYLDDKERAVRETCEIAIAKIEWDNSEEGRREHQARLQRPPTYTSEDPAPPSSDLLASALHTSAPSQHSRALVSSSASPSVPELKATLLDISLPLFERYRAMFSLRNIGTPEAVDALSAGFSDSSALFKHEIAFIFGQILSPHSVPSLLSVLQDSNEEDMVRHEAAEALGGIATPEVLPHLREWMKRDDAPRVVRESCEVAVDMWEYENSDQFQYADGLESGAANEAAPHGVSVPTTA